MNLYDDSIIVAYCTASAKSAISILRISGKGSAEFSDLFFRFYKDEYKSKKQIRKVQDMKGYRAAFGYVYDVYSNEKIDDAIITRFVAPYSYTGEEMVEVSIHGSLASQKALMELVLKLGARAATAGEFTKRAFLNGKLDLLQAEAVLELINSEGQAARKSALNRLDGKLSNVFNELRSNLYYLLSEIEVSIAYPEYDENEVDLEKLENSLEDIRKKFIKLASGHKQAKLLDDGIKVAILGAPNAGKSTLLNSLLGYERAIVSNIAGTTRDTVESRLEINGVIINLIDTAGLRESDDFVEKIGIERSKQAAKDADLILWLIESTRDIDSIKKELYDLDKYRRDINADIYILISKSDLKRDESIVELCKASYAEDLVFEFSSVEEDGSERVLEFLKDYCQNIENDFKQAPLVSSQRQYQVLLNIIDRLSLIINDIKFLPLDISSQALKSVVEELALLTGENVSENLLEDIFANFCVGK